MCFNVPLRFVGFALCNIMITLHNTKRTDFTLTRLFVKTVVLSVYYHFMYRLKIKPFLVHSFIQCNVISVQHADILDIFIQWLANDQPSRSGLLVFYPCSCPLDEQLQQREKVNKAYVLLTFTQQTFSFGVQV